MADEPQHGQEDPPEVPDSPAGSQPAASPDAGDYPEPGPEEGNDQAIAPDAPGTAGDQGSRTPDQGEPQPMDLPEGGKREQMGADPSHADPTDPPPETAAPGTPSPAESQQNGS